MGLYERYFLPKILDFAMRQEPIMRQRGKVVPKARGAVLEVGLGSGLNLPFYDRSSVDRVVGLEPSEELRTLARERARDHGVELEFLGLTGEEIPCEDGAFDSIVITYTLCTIPDAPKALAEIHRVLKPGGRMWFCEHGLAPTESVAKWQRRISPLWERIAGGCNLDRRIPQMIEEAGFRIDSLEQMHLPGPKVLTYNYWGGATPTGAAPPAESMEPSRT